MNDIVTEQGPKQPVRKNATIGVPLRYILAPLPLGEVIGRTQYARTNYVGKGKQKKIEAIFKNNMPSVGSFTEEYRELHDNYDMLPSAKMGRNAHAIILGDIWHRIHRQEDDPYVVTYELRDLVERMGMTPSQHTNNKIHACIQALRWMSVIYRENGALKNQPTISGSAEYIRNEDTHFARAERAIFERGKGRGNTTLIQLEVRKEYFHTFSPGLQFVSEPLYMMLNHPFQKDLYAFIVYLNHYVKHIPEREFSREWKDFAGQCLDKQQGEEINKNNQSMYSAYVKETIKLIQTHDHIIGPHVSMEGKDITVTASDYPETKIQATKQQRVLATAPQEVSRTIEDSWIYKSSTPDQQRRMKEIFKTEMQNLLTTKTALAPAGMVEKAELAISRAEIAITGDPLKDIKVKFRQS